MAKFIVKFNGHDLTDYISVTWGFGRGIISSRSNTVQKIGNSNGVKLLDTTRSESTIPMPFVMLQRTQEKCDIVASILNVTEPKELIFGDQPDRVYYAIPTGNVSFDDLFNHGKGQIDWLIPESISHANSVKTATNDGAKDTIKFNNNGTDSTPLKITTTMKSDNGFLGLTLGKRFYQIGNPGEVNGVPLKSSETLVPGDYMPMLSEGTVNKAGFVVIPPDQGAMRMQGSLKNDSNRDMSVKDFGSDNRSPRGPSWTYELPADKNGEKGVTDFTFRFHTMFGSKRGSVRDVGQLCATVHDDKGNTLCSALFQDLFQGKEDFTVRYDINGKQYYSKSISVPEGFNKGHAAIIKSGSNFTFSYQLDKQVTFVCDELKDAKAYYISFSWLKWDTVPTPLYYKVINWNFSKNYEAFNDIPNFFKEKDIVTLDSSKNLLTINDFKNWDRVDIGSQPLIAEPGENELGIVVSDWAEMPDVNIEFRERYL